MDKSSAAYQDQLAHWTDDKTSELRGTAIVLIIITCLTIALRFWAQRIIRKEWALDNIIILFAAVNTIAVTAACLVAFSNGVGKHMARVVATDPHKPRQLITILKARYIIGVLQGPCFGLIKVSILLFYRRIFTMHRRTFQVAFYILGTYTALLTIATTIVFMLLCLPISFSWNRAYLIEGIPPPHPVNGHCSPQKSSVVATLVANTVSDIALLVLPAIGIWNLRLPRGKKVGLFGVFSLGIFVVFVGGIRIYFGYKATDTIDIPWINAHIMMLTAVESCVGIVCASLPPMAPLLKKSENSPISPRVIWSRILSLFISSSSRSHLSRSRSHTHADPFDQDGNCSLQALQPVHKEQQVSVMNV